ncbi:MAG: NADP-dependent oxidoreductase [Candidatus Hodarchaeota archaeon]
MTEEVNQEILLIKRPVGIPTENDFKLVDKPIPNPGDGEVLVRNIYMSVDPYMRGRMIDQESYVPPFELNKTLQGGCVGEVVKSNNNKYQAGEYVFSMIGWRKYYVSDGTGLTKVDSSIAPIQAYLGILGLTGLTAYVGLLDIGQLKEGETVFVSGASGAVGSVVCQIAKINNCYVLGSAGSDEKVKWLLDELEIDAAFNYKTVSNLTSEVRKKCTKGVDVYFDNVGSSHLDAALANMNTFGRIVGCGMISQYNLARPDSIQNLITIIPRRLTIRGFIITDHYNQMPDFMRDMGAWIKEGKIKWKETIIEGIEKAPSAFIGLFKGENIGKMLVKLD